MRFLLTGAFLLSVLPAGELFRQLRPKQPEEAEVDPCRTLSGCYI